MKDHDESTTVVFLISSATSVDGAGRRKCKEASEIHKFSTGTLRPDLIESASALANVGGRADCIKTHHNDTQLVRNWAKGF